MSAACPRCGSTGESGGCRACDPNRATTRYAKTPVTFGVWGRVGWTVGFLAIPFTAFAYEVEKNEYVLDVTKELLETAPGFDPNHWPKMTEQWNRELYKHYKHVPYWE